MNTTCYCAAVRTAARKTTALYDSILAPAGVTLAQYSLLRRIQRAGTVSLTETRAAGRIGPIDGRAQREGPGRTWVCAYGLGRRPARGGGRGSRPPATRRWSAPRRCGRKRSGGSRLIWAPPRPGGFGRLRSVFDFFANMRALTRNTGLKNDCVGARCNDFERFSAAKTARAVLSFRSDCGRHGRTGRLLRLDRRRSDLPRHAGDGGSDGRAGRHHPAART